MLTYHSFTYINIYYLKAQKENAQMGLDSSSSMLESLDDKNGEEGETEASNVNYCCVSRLYVSAKSIFFF
ncbi:hypothetical protein RchiOBHm_Chr4g0410781 [Rosa chinensis]|uniref:Uncharacterized protein n=1 Tax=Rosa chinensis TaxID=74649 RepID=A0A2P6QVF5_ROSCH|nr:hypothetical protein RchiOBHm_Chr4g0410781 [Rosa chinensis]